MGIGKSRLRPVGSLVDPTRGSSTIPEAPLFESWISPRLASRLRSLLVWPVSTFLTAQAYYSVIPFVRSLPAFLFYSVLGALAAGAILPAIAAVRMVRLSTAEMDWRTVTSLLLLSFAISLNLLLLLRMTVPWLIL